jgi:hypothetical protein
MFVPLNQPRLVYSEALWLHIATREINFSAGASPATFGACTSVSGRSAQARSIAEIRCGLDHEISAVHFNTADADSIAFFPPCLPQ